MPFELNANQSSAFYIIRISNSTTMKSKSDTIDIQALIKA